MVFVAFISIHGQTQALRQPGALGTQKVSSYVQRLRDGRHVSLVKLTQGGTEWSPDGRVVRPGFSPSGTRPNPRIKLLFSIQASTNPALQRPNGFRIGDSGSGTHATFSLDSSVALGRKADPVQVEMIMTAPPANRTSGDLTFGFAFGDYQDAIIAVRKKKNVFSWLGASNLKQISNVNRRFYADGIESLKIQETVDQVTISAELKHISNIDAVELNPIAFHHGKPLKANSASFRIGPTSSRHEVIFNTKMDGGDRIVIQERPVQFVIFRNVSYTPKL